VVCLLSFDVQAKYGGGSGTAEDPYQIWTAEQMNSIGADPNDWDKHFKLAADIDLSTYRDGSFNPIGSRWGRRGTRPYSGVFDGDGHAILNLTCSSNETYPFGLLAYVGGRSAEVKNLRLLSPKIDAPEAGRVGALIGSLSTGTVTDCHVEGGNLSANHAVGGLIGESGGTILNCSCTAEVHSDHQVGGLVGRTYSGTVTGCHSHGVVTGRARVGGLVGENEADIISCYAAGTVTGERYTGGLIGDNDQRGDVVSCFSTTNVKGTDLKAGGLVGFNAGVIKSSWASGNVEGNACVGGFAGATGGTISHCYATGAVQGQVSVAGFSGGKSGLIFFSYSVGKVSGNEDAAGFGPGGSAYLCYWDIETSEIAQSGAGKGATTAEMMTASTFAGWGYESQWVIEDAADYPRLIWEETSGELLVDPPRTYGGGTGEPNDPYLIQTAEQLVLIACYREDLDKHFLLTSDINFGDIDVNEFIPIGAAGAGFVGSFDGNGHAILNFEYSAEGQDDVGLFGAVGGSLRNIHLVDVIVSGGRHVGALVGSNSGDVCNCSVTGTVEGVVDVGGLVGYHAGQMEACVVEAQVTGQGSVGGLAGRNFGRMQACAAGGRVTAQSSVGGLCGYNYRDIATSYSTADVMGETEVGGLVGATGSARFWTICPAPPPSFVPGLSDSRITACYCTGQVTGQQALGGLVGKNAGVIMGCYAACPITEIPIPPIEPNSPPDRHRGPRGPVLDVSTHAYSDPGADADVGGLVGENEYGIVHLSYWDTELSGLSESAGGRGRTTDQMSTAETFRGWEYFGVWVMDQGGGYPHLRWTHLPGKPIVDDPDRYGAGVGTPAAPYEIWTPEHFVNVAYHPNDWDKHFVLMSDLDLSSVDPNTIWPIGTFTVPFIGTLDGNGHTIANLTYHSDLELYAGMFGHIGGSPSEPAWRAGRLSSTPTARAGIVSNLNLENVDVSGYCHVGGLAARNEGRISSCSVQGHVTANLKNAGGLVGFNVGTLVDCSADCNVTAKQVVGSLAGYSGGPVTSCLGSGVVGTTSERYSCAGGLIGENDDVVRLCSFCGDVVGGYTAGGLVALNERTISSCSSHATVTGSYLVGGLVGYNDYYATVSESFSGSTVIGGISVGGLVGCNDGMTQNCFAAGEARGERQIGGLAGQCYRDMMFCYSTCLVNGQGVVAGLAGELSSWGDITSCFWDLDTSGVTDGVATEDPDPNGVLGLPTASMQAGSTFVAAGWDFVGESENGTEDIWAICEGVDYPKLTWQFVIADFDGDDDTDFADFCALAARWLATDGSFWCGDGRTDLTDDGEVDFADLGQLAENWLTGVQ
jgi:hypothetical protein